MKRMVKHRLTLLTLGLLIATGIVVTGQTGGKITAPRMGAISMPTWRPPNGDKVAFVYTVGGDSEIYITDKDGKNIKNLSNNKAVDMNPVWSPDGQTLLFTSRRNNQFDIFKVTGFGKGTVTPKRITQNESDDMWPAWSPDGNTIAYCSYGEKKIKQKRNGRVNVQTAEISGKFPKVYLISSEGGKPELFYDRTAEKKGNKASAERDSEQASCYPAFSSDGKQLALSSGGDLLVFKLKDKKNKNITKPLIEGNMVEDTLPVWAPRGNRIAFIGKYEGYSSEIYTISGSGKKVRRITDDLFENFLPQWKPDGQGVIYSAFVSGRPPEIFVSEPESPRKQRLTQNFSVEMSPCYSPDGESILYVKRGSIQDELYIMTKDGKDQKPFLKEKLPGPGDRKRKGQGE